MSACCDNGHVHNFSSHLQFMLNNSSGHLHQMCKRHTLPNTCLSSIYIFPTSISYFLVTEFPLNNRAKVRTDLVTFPVRSCFLVFFLPLVKHTAGELSPPCVLAVLQVHMADNDHGGLTEACMRLGDSTRGGDPHLWSEVLEYFVRQPQDCTEQVWPTN